MTPNSNLEETDLANTPYVGHLQWFMTPNSDREETDLASKPYVGHLQLFMTRDSNQEETDLASKGKVMHASLLTRPAAERFFRRSDTPATRRRRASGVP